MRAHRPLLALLVAGLACGSAEPSTDLDPVRIPVTVETVRGPVTFQAEIADDHRERQRGLMFREALGDREGMLFVFPVEQQLSFWMKNTLIPLDMVFIRADRTVLGVVREAEPRTLTSRSVPGKSQYVLEIRGGLADTLGIRAGQSVRFMAPAALE